MKVEGIKVHTIKHMWEAYSKKIVEANPDCITVYQNNIHNFYIFKPKTRSKIITTVFPSRTSYRREYSMDGLIFSYEMFRKIIDDYFMKARKEIVEGNALRLNTMGVICGKRVERDYRKSKQRMINWQKTKLQPLVYDEALGRDRYEKKIYFTGDDWCRIAWCKTVPVTNMTVYEFTPTSSTSGQRNGFKSQFTDALASNPLLKYQYLFEPIYYPPIKPTV